MLGFLNDFETLSVLKSYVSFQDSLVISFLYVMSVLHGACISTELNDLNLIILARYFDQDLDFQWQLIHSY